MINILTYFIMMIFSLNYLSSGEELLKKLQDKFEKINDLTAEFKQSTNEKAAINGKFFFKKKDMLRVELKKSILISNGVTNWNFNQKENKVIISKNEDNASPLSLNKVIYDYPRECSISSEIIEREEVLILTPNKNSSIGYSLVKIWVNNENLIKQIVMKDKADNQIRIDFTNYRINQKIPDSKFSFSPPEGSKVIDLR